MYTTVVVSPPQSRAWKNSLFGYNATDGDLLGVVDQKINNNFPYAVEYLPLAYTFLIL